MTQLTRAVVDVELPELESATAEVAVAWALRSFARGRVAVVTALQKEGMVVVDLALRLDPAVRIATIDTGRLPAETHAFLDTARARYRRDIEVRRPQPDRVVDFLAAHGPDAFAISPELRLACCELRKVEPAAELLGGLDCWLTGLRRGHSSLRADTPVAERDHAHGGIVKVNPLAAWSEAQVDAYLAEHAVPVHPLYAQGYRSIGCAPCTRAVSPGADIRSGRWWWEQGVDTECGIHRRPRLAGVGGEA
ncbi:MAG TPA: phosphoadenylyl-sulfate reductase [Candidatus Dormibacteraeota bacterium]